ncbi:MAG: hypothetical protein MJE77_32165, partial [Proteobacteria bacterium]|nr:hypothetical protein [Pseudomonadota bacterium]
MGPALTARGRASPDTPEDLLARTSPLPCDDLGRISATAQALAEKHNALRRKLDPRSKPIR